MQAVQSLEKRTSSSSKSSQAPIFKAWPESRPFSQVAWEQTLDTFQVHRLHTTEYLEAYEGGCMTWSLLHVRRTFFFTCEGVWRGSAIPAIQEATNLLFWFWAAVGLPPALSRCGASGLCLSLLLQWNRPCRWGTVCRPTRQCLPHHMNSSQLKK